MRREMRKNKEKMNIKIIKYSGITVAILTVIVLGILIYSKKLNDDIKEGTLMSEQLSSMINNTTSESASTEIGKSINEVSNELKQDSKNNSVANNSKVNNTTSNNTVSKNAEANSVLTTNKINANNTTSQTNSKAEENKNVELSFEKPVEGEVIRDFAVDNLIYSNTLQEWTTHTGIDIKADKTTVVKSAEAGTVKTVKNDPRYGLTIIIEHQNGFQTVYSNLLTSEFVVEGEKVEKGQSLGTVGNTAAFEVADEPHLHFEILKDSAQVDPNIYLK